MKNASINLNSGRQNIYFKGDSVDFEISLLKTAKRAINCGFDNLEKNLTSTVQKKAPDLIKNIDGETYISTKDTFARKITSSLKSFFGMPLDIVDAIGKKFPNSPINRLKILQKYRASVKFENELRALQGIQGNGMEFAKKAVIPEFCQGDKCENLFEGDCGKILKKFNVLLNDSMSDSKAVYDTKKERFWTRIISGFTAAMFLGNDFYNKSIQKGKNDAEAKREQHLKQGQEVKENICEAITQFAVFSFFSRAVNKNVWSSAVISTVIGLISRVISRVSSGMPIRRIKVPYKNNSKTLSIDEYMNASKEGKVKEQQIKKEKMNSDKKHKKPILSARNIILFCLASILGGYSLRFLKGHTEIGKLIAEKINEHNKKFSSEIIEDVIADKDKLCKLKDIITEKDYQPLAQTIESVLSANNDQQKILIGKQFKTTKIFGVEVKVKDIKMLKTAPFRFIKELISYPYKIVSKLSEAIKNKSSNASQEVENIADRYQIKNLYNRFLEFEQKYGNDDVKLKEEFGNYLKQMRLLSNNDVTSSSCNNSKIAVLAQTLGALTGMWFNMNDEFNSSIRNGSSKYVAEKDARLRGINKFFRMTVQIIISGTLNGIFEKQYNKSLGSAALIVATSTFLTDMASRLLTGMPSRKMTKEELDKYQKDHKEGIMSGYYKFIDKLAS